MRAQLLYCERPAAVVFYQWQGRGANHAVCDGELVDGRLPFLFHAAAFGVLHPGRGDICGAEPELCRPGAIAGRVPEDGTVFQAAAPARACGFAAAHEAAVRFFARGAVPRFQPAAPRICAARAAVPHGLLPGLYARVPERDPEEAHFLNGFKKFWRAGLYL